MAATMSYASAPVLTTAAAAPTPAPSKPAQANYIPQFAFARLRGSVYLVHCVTPPSALSATELTVFRHELISIFRLSHSTTVHPSEAALLERIEPGGAHYDEDTGTVYLARETMDRMRKLSGPPRMRPSVAQQYSSPRARRVTRGWPQA